MNLVEKLEPLILILAIAAGLLLSNVGLLTSNTGFLINIFLCLMLYGLFLEVPLKDLKSSFKNTRFTTTSLIINFIWTPLFGYFLGSLFLKGNIDILIGFFMLILTPCTDWYLVFTKLARGDLNLSLSILPVNLVLQIILLPVYLLIFFSASNALNYLDLLYSLLIVIIIPFTVSQITRFLLNDSLKSKITDAFTSCQLLFLALAVFSIFNSEASLLFDNLDSVLVIFIPLIIFFIVNVIIAIIVSKRVNFTYNEYASLTMTILARNSPLALAIAVNSFPSRELIAIALVIGPLIELPVLYAVSRFVLKISGKLNLNQ